LASRLIPQRSEPCSNSANAFPWDSAPRYLLRDRDRIFGKNFVEQVKAMGIKQVSRGAKNITNMGGFGRYR
jgi:hypothetical protein